MLKGKVSPRYLALDERSLALARQVIEVFTKSVGEKRASLNQKLQELELKETDYKLVRGLAAILYRRCNYIVDSKLEPMSTRSVVFEEASRRRVVTLEERNQVLLESSARMNVSATELEDSLFKDLEDEQVLSSFDREKMDPDLLVKQYNLALAQTALFKSVSMEFTASGNWKRIFREIKWLGLMYAVEKGGTAEEDKYTVYLDGPLSLFKMTERYGTSLAKLLPAIVCGTDSWSFKAELVDRHKNNRMLHFEEKSPALFASFFGDEGSYPIFDSSVEEKFASRFNSLNTGWALRREPEPLIAGRHVLIPDFSFEKYGIKVFMEIVGFWTKEYIERKLSKLSSLKDVDIIVALNESLRCSESKLSSVKQASSLLLTYSKEVPLEPILSRLKMLEQNVEEKQLEQLRSGERFGFTGDSVNLVDVANARKISIGILKRALGESVKGYRMIGDHLLSESKIEAVRKELEKQKSSDLTLSQAVHIIAESCGVSQSRGTASIPRLHNRVERTGLRKEQGGDALNEIMICTPLKKNFKRNYFLTLKNCTIHTQRYTARSGREGKGRVLGNLSIE